MDRQILHTLIAWREEKGRIPLLLRGARQVGKTFIVRQFAEKCFKYFVEINFEYDPLYKECFNSLDPNEIIQAIRSISRVQILEEETLLFLDEIQECPQAIMALRYFKEMMPKLHVIAAGSLLEFSIQEESFRMPVGRVQSLYMHPMSFIEFLRALGYEALIESLKKITLEEPIQGVLHKKLLALIKDYMFVGGMPDAVQSYVENNDYIRSQYKQAILLDTYRRDFGKYASKKNIQYIQKVFDRAPFLIGKSIKYSHIDEALKARELKQAIQSLALASIIRPIYATPASGVPLQASINEKKFKWLFLDIGLVSRSTHVSIHEILNENISLIHKGALAEQLVGQELLVHQNGYLESQLYYWCREVVGSQAEVDYIIMHHHHIIPVEVKSGTTGQLKSLHLFMKEKQSSLGVRISEAPLSYHAPLLSVPFYLIEELPRLLDAILFKQEIG